MLYFLEHNGLQYIVLHNGCAWLFKLHIYAALRMCLLSTTDVH